MLVITRRVGQTFTIGDEISVVILNVKGNQVRLGIDAPKSVKILRDDIKERLSGEDDTQEDEAGQVTEDIQVAQD